MKSSKLAVALMTIVCSLLLAHEARAQGQGLYGFTSIDYDESTNIVTAYSETNADLDIASDYDAHVILQVLDQYGIPVATKAATSPGTYVSVQIEFTASPGATYTAVGIHQAYANFYTFDDFGRQWWYDNYFFGFFEGQSINNPAYYHFLSPGFAERTRRLRPINLGKTYDSTTTSGDDVQFVGVAVDDGTPVSFEDGTAEAVPWKANVNVSCGGERFKVVVKFNLPQDSGSCCNAVNSRINVFSTSKFELTENPVYGYSSRFFPDTSPPAAPDTSPPLAVAFVKRKADGSGSSNTLRVLVGGSYQGGQSYSTLANVHLNCN